jgi:predicted transcriptional regulator
MDALTAAAARALDAGDVLGALKRVALREDPEGLAIRGVALARLADFERARELLRRAARAFGGRAPLQRARCLLADAEIALVTRELRGVAAALAEASDALAAHGDRVNQCYADCLSARCLLLQNRAGDAARILQRLERTSPAAPVTAQIALAWADYHQRMLDGRGAQAALERAARAAALSSQPALAHEVALARARLAEPLARAWSHHEARDLRIDELAALLRDRAALVFDAREGLVRSRARTVALSRRPVLFALARALAEAWPGGARRDDLILRAFAANRPNSSHRARLRVEIARLRRALGAQAKLEATADGFRLGTPAGVSVVVLTRVWGDEHASLLALLTDAEAWSSSSLAVALGASQRSVQRSLQTLEQEGKVRAHGRARARRWGLAGEFPPGMLLPPSAILA